MDIYLLMPNSAKTCKMAQNDQKCSKICSIGQYLTVFNIFFPVLSSFSIYPFMVVALLCITVSSFLLSLFMHSSHLLHHRLSVVAVDASIGCRVGFL